MGPQKLATIIGHKYSIFKPSKKNKGVFLIIKIGQIIRSKRGRVFSDMDAGLWHFLGSQMVRLKERPFFLLALRAG